MRERVSTSPINFAENSASSKDETISKRRRIQVNPNLQKSYLRDDGCSKLQRKSIAQTNLCIGKTEKVKKN